MSPDAEVAHPTPLRPRGRGARLGSVGMATSRESGVLTDGYETRKRRDHQAPPAFAAAGWPRATGPTLCGDVSMTPAVRPGPRPARSAGLATVADRPDRRVRRRRRRLLDRAAPLRTRSLAVSGVSAQPKDEGAVTLISSLTLPPGEITVPVDTRDIQAMITATVRHDAVKRLRAPPRWNTPDEAVLLRDRCSFCSQSRHRAGRLSE